ncbi:hypothetical protein GCM10009087_55110 [Sphingomonas oligophenolica]|uniref:Response regulatory domain-containing protein n=1 Tax=Sphingomonas oligophenolica TaxID=301154 RepID=A0ABU9Y595_9SPHN
MMHAIIIGREGAAASAAVNRLWDAGYHSIFRVDEPSEAPALLACVHPDLILALPDSVVPDSMNMLRRISKAADAPVVVAKLDVEHALGCLGPSEVEESTYLPPRREYALPLAA